ncbi:hypothetical protein IV203_027884 [Nitzschia inconspicua]|uniref:Uncharacterized protein n=1 Tax=Nitzschia inconspicua TaxID=303405 RepID=A0A9K3Q3V5_9STRA|nr:hypothetical protein IV203_027884 [Nitzschia inconspicua]
MVTTPRSSGGKVAASVDPFRDRKHQRRLAVHAAGIHRLGQGTKECFDLVQHILAQAAHGYWYRILPLDSYDDIAVGTGVEWQYLLPLLSKCSLLRSRVTSVVKEIDCNAQVSAIEKPLLTLEHRQQRVQWAKKWYHLLSNSQAPVAFLDEKWFYTTNRRRRVKILPPTVSENGKVRVYHPPQVRSRRHPAKVMYLGVVACPKLQKGFDGRVCLHRVSRTKILARASRNTRYSVDVDNLQAIKSGEWIQLLVTEGMTAEALLEEIKTHYDLDEYVSDRLVIGYYTYTRQGVKARKELHPIDIVNELGMRTYEGGVQVVIHLQDLEVFVQQEAGDKVEEDISCDSDFMLRKIPEIGAGLRSAYHWLRRDETIYLIMDNAGGHGSHDAMAQYTSVLWNEYKVQLVWQIPRSPETNMLDLGIWMSIQAVVTRVHHRL